MSVCQLKRQEGESGGAFFHPQVWQSNSSLETCKVSRETNWPFDTAEACIMSRETFESRLSRTFIITILLTSQKPTLMLKLQHRPNSFKHSWIPITYMYIRDTPLFAQCLKIHSKSLILWKWKNTTFINIVNPHLSQPFKSILFINRVNPYLP